MTTSHLVGRMTYTEVLHTLTTLSSPKKAERIFPQLKVQDKVLGIGLMKLRALSKTIKKDHERAQKLWQSGIYEAKLLATLTEELPKVSEEQMDKQVEEIKTHAVADYFTKNIVAKSPYLLQKANSWVFMDKPLMVRHIGYACVCQLAKSNQNLDNNYFEKHLIIIDVQIEQAKSYAKDGQINALIAIGSRNKHLNKKALKVARKIGKTTLTNSRSTKIVDVVKLLKSDKIQSKIVD